MVHKTKRISKLRQGQTVYTVRVFLGWGGTQAADVETVVVGSKAYRPYYKSVTKGFSSSYFFNIKAEYEDIWSRSCMDFNMQPQNYNMNRLFTSKKKAQHYVDMVRSGCDVSGMFAKRHQHG